MESIAEIARACLGSFRKLMDALTEASVEYCKSMPPDKLEWEFGRFKLWCGNLGALQNGKSSLDSRLRKSVVVRTNVLRHLARLDQTLIKSTEVTSGARPPLENQLQTLEDSGDESSSEESVNDDEPPKELVLHMDTIKEILNDLYVLSFRIRRSSTRPSLNSRVERYSKAEHYNKAERFSEVDDETGIDKFAAYTAFDKRHVEESLLEIRRCAAKEIEREPSGFAEITAADQYLIDRLVVTMNRRRRVLRYWQSYARITVEMPKLGRAVVKSQPMPTSKAAKIMKRSMIEQPGEQIPYMVPSLTEQSMFSKTEAATTLDKLHNDGLRSNPSSPIFQYLVTFTATRLISHRHQPQRLRDPNSCVPTAALSFQLIMAKAAPGEPTSSRIFSRTSAHTSNAKMETTSLVAAQHGSSTKGSATELGSALSTQKRRSSPKPHCSIIWNPSTLTKSPRRKFRA